MGRAYAKGFRDLVVYQKSRGLAREVFAVSRGFPREEVYSITDQMLRASRSLGAQIAEAWAKRRYEKHFVSKLTDAEQQETQHWIESAMDCGYLTPDQTARLVNQYAEIGRMLGSMMEKADMFCGQQPMILRESAAEYFTTNY